ncbi:hypothetical protein MTR67_006042 [Solanum verrucosum]|uniref:Ulp1 protease family, C-terminal catalytic domain containing protein n=1 Tax=Solanum verrucosum TaxID=315347 RepID=A0AAF0PXG2_SOLVR|nr:hypothetical protein MTR67_006042 [Solanum verrucosum]
MDAQSPSKRFTRGIPLHVENSVERPSFSLGLTQDFGEVSGSMSKSNTMQEIKSKLKNNPIRLEGMSAKSKQSNIKIVEGEPTSTVIDRKDFDLVESGRYIDYPWGKKGFDLLILHLHTKIKHDGKYFRLYGFPLALQVWFYECCSNFDEEIAVKLVFKNITPTPMELKILELPPEYVQSDSPPT